MSGVQQQGLGINDNRTIASVEEFEFEPIKGYPMLLWHGKRPFRSTRFYPAQLKEVYGPEIEGWRNKIYWGDNLQVMSHLLKQYRGQVKLAYIDPPFDSKADYKKTISPRGSAVSNDYNSFEDKQYSDIWINDEYLQFIYERIVLLRELLSPGGTIWVHCDWHKIHYLRLILEEVFGLSGFLNEIAWKRKAATSYAGKKLGIANDSILWFSKSSDFTFHPIHSLDDDDTKEYIQERFRFRTAEGRVYKVDNLGNPDYRPNLIYEYKGHKPPANGWAVSLERMKRMDAEGRLEFPKKPGGRLMRRQFLDEYKGQRLQNLWLDIPMVNSQAKERQAYPTQKPEALLNRIIQIATDPGDLVLDCFMGSGTTQAAAMRLGRRFIGADINLGAVQITTKRLLQIAEDLAIKNSNTQKPQQAAIAYGDSANDNGANGEDGDAAALPEPTVYYTGFEVYNVNYYDVFRNPAQAKELLLQALEVQPLAAGSVFDGTMDGRMVKLMPVNRIATRADLNDLLANIDHKSMDRLYQENPNRAVEKITLVCMGHEPDLAAYLKQELHPYKVDVEVVDVLRDRQDLQFKRDSEARVKVKGGKLVIEAFYPMNLLQKLSMQQEAVEDWRELVESVMVDWNYDGAILTPALVDIPERNEMVRGTYKVPDDAGTIRVKITDLLSESWEGIVTYG